MRSLCSDAGRFLALLTVLGSCRTEHEGRREPVTLENSVNATQHQPPRVTGVGIFEPTTGDVTFVNSLGTSALLDGSNVLPGVTVRNCQAAVFDPVALTLSVNAKIYNGSTDVQYFAPVELRLTRIRETNLVDAVNTDLAAAGCGATGLSLLQDDSDGNGVFDCIYPDDPANTADDPGWDFSHSLGSDSALAPGESSDCRFIRFHLKRSAAFAFYYQVLGVAGYHCTPQGPCASGIGDCETDADCATSLVCGQDTGPRYGYPADFDVCAPPHCTNGVQDAEETGIDCGGTCLGSCTHPGSPGDAGYCSAAFPCGSGIGDCDSDAGCAAGLVCGQDLGASYGYSADTDVCVPPACVTPTADICNGVDDDCNPTTADGSGDPLLGQPCDGPDTDTCNGGVWQCPAGGPLTCSDSEEEDCDLTDPVVSIAGPSPNALFGSQPVHLSVTWTDPPGVGAISGIDTTSASISVDGIDFTNVMTITSSGVEGEIAGLGDSSHTIAVTISDLAGNTGDASVQISVDPAPPTVTWTNPSSPAYVEVGTVPFDFTLADSSGGLVLTALAVTANGAAVSGITCTPPGDGIASSNCHGTYDFTEGEWSLAVSIADTAGNVATSSLTLIADSTAPIIELTPDPDGSFVSGGNATLPLLGRVLDTLPTTFFVNGEQVSVTGGAFSTQVTLNEGPNEIVLDAVDSLQHQTSRTIHVTLEGVPPQVVDLRVSGQPHADLSPPTGPSLDCVDPSSPYELPQVTINNTMSPVLYASYADAAGVSGQGIAMTIDGAARACATTSTAPGSVDNNLQCALPLSGGDHVLALAIPDRALGGTNVRRCAVNVHIDSRIVYGQPGTPLQSAIAEIPSAYMLGADHPSVLPATYTPPPLVGGDALRPIGPAMNVLPRPSLAFGATIRVTVPYDPIRLVSADPDGLTSDELSEEDVRVVSRNASGDWQVEQPPQWIIDPVANTVTYHTGAPSEVVASVFVRRPVAAISPSVILDNSSSVKTPSRLLLMDSRNLKRAPLGGDAVLYKAMLDGPGVQEISNYSGFAFDSFARQSVMTQIKAVKAGIMVQGIETVAVHYNNVWTVPPAAGSTAKLTVDLDEIALVTLKGKVLGRVRVWRPQDGVTTTKIVWNYVCPPEGVCGYIPQVVPDVHAVQLAIRDFVVSEAAGSIYIVADSSQGTQRTEGDGIYRVSLFDIQNAFGTIHLLQPASSLPLTIGENAVLAVSTLWGQPSLFLAAAGPRGWQREDSSATLEYSAVSADTLESQINDSSTGVGIRPFGPYYGYERVSLHNLIVSYDALNNLRLQNCRQDLSDEGILGPDPSNPLLCHYIDPGTDTHRYAALSLEALGAHSPHHHDLAMNMVEAGQILVLQDTGTTIRRVGTLPLVAGDAYQYPSDPPPQGDFEFSAPVTDPTSSLSVDDEGGLWVRETWVRGLRTWVSAGTLKLHGQYGSTTVARVALDPHATIDSAVQNAPAAEVTDLSTSVGRSSLVLTAPSAKATAVVLGNDGSVVELTVSPPLSSRVVTNNNGQIVAPAGLRLAHVVPNTVVLGDAAEEGILVAGVAGAPGSPVSFITRLSSPAGVPFGTDLTAETHQGGTTNGFHFEFFNRLPRAPIAGYATRTIIPESYPLPKPVLSINNGPTTSALVHLEDSLVDELKVRISKLVVTKDAQDHVVTRTVPTSLAAYQQEIAEKAPASKVVVRVFVSLQNSESKVITPDDAYPQAGSDAPTILMEPTPVEGHPYTFYIAMDAGGPGVYEACHEGTGDPWLERYDPDEVSFGVTACAERSDPNAICVGGYRVTENHNVLQFVFADLYICGGTPEYHQQSPAGTALLNQQSLVSEPVRVVLGTLPTTCDAFRPCATGQPCVDGFCCDQPCGGDNRDDCLACAAALGADADGVCTLLPAGTVCGHPTCDPAPVCSGIDPVCPGDEDGDGHFVPDSCAARNDDCDDTRAEVYPGAPELCDGIDNDCNDQADEYVDADGDGHYPHGSCGTPADDLDDNDPTVHDERCNGVDDGTDGLIDEDLPACMPGAAAPGNMAGSFNVSPSGAAQYSVPLFVPPGRNGVQPSLALSYSSDQGDGWVGYGWSLSGFPEIRRCRRNPVDDGFVHAVTFDEGDAFCLDGVRLVPVEDSGCGTGIAYRTQTDTLRRICAFGAGPDYFVVHHADGTTDWFGDSTPGGTAATVRAAQGILAWGIRRVEDQYQNYMLYEYGNAGVTTLPDDGISGHQWMGTDYYVTEIKYTGHASDLSPQRHVRFLYDTEGTDAPVSYFAGNKFAQKRMLKAIEAYGPSGLARVYKLYHERSSATGMPLLKSLQECASYSECKRPTRFEWLQPSQVAVERRSSAQNLLPEYPGMASVSDVDGDGRDEVVLIANDADYEVIHWGEPLDVPMTYDFALHREDTGQDPLPIRVRPLAHPQPIDFNNDGAMELLLSAWCDADEQTCDPRNDLLVLDLDAPRGQAYRIADDGPFDGTWVGDFDGDGTHDVVVCRSGVFNYVMNTQTGGLASQPLNPWAIGPPCFSDDKAFVLDVDGDGASELIVNPDASSGRAPSARKFSTSSVTGVSVPGLPSGASVKLIMDKNGDGLKDLLLDVDGYYRFYYNTGGAFAEWTGYGAASCGVSTEAMLHARAFDYDRDGLDDIVLPNFDPELTCPHQELAPTAQWIVLRSTPSGFSVVPTGIFAKPDWETTRDWQLFEVADMDGNGTSDILYSVSEDTGVAITLREGFAHDLLTAVREGTNPRDGSPQGGLYPANTSVTYAQSLDASVWKTTEVCPTGFRCRQSGRALVKSMSSFSGILPGGLRTWSYTYENGRTHIGRGWVGFGKTTVVDALTGSETVAEYDNSTKVRLYRPGDSPGAPTGAVVYPYAGRARKVTVTTSVVQETPGGQVDVRDHIEQTTITPTHGLGNGGRTVMVATAETRHDVSEQVPGEPALHYGTTRTVASNFNEYMQAQHSSTCSWTDSVGMAVPAGWLSTLVAMEAAGQCRTTDRTFTHDTQKWLIGRVQTETVEGLSSFCSAALGAGLGEMPPDTWVPPWAEIPAGGQWPDDYSECPVGGHGKQQRVYTYYPTGRVYTVTTEDPEDGDTHLEVEYAYDGYGNVSTMTKRGHDPNVGVDTRVWGYTMDTAEQLFVEVTTSPIPSLAETRLYDRALGVVTSETDANGLVTTFTYDSFGRPTGSSVPGGPTKTITYQDLVGSLLNVAMQTTEHSSDGGHVVTTYDRLLRPISVSRLTAEGQNAVQTTEYDARGNVQSRCLPGFGAASTECYVAEYDNLNRVRSAHERDGDTSSFYDGYTVTTLDGEGNPSTTIANQAGQVIAAVDGEGGITRYYYDAFGAIWRVVDPSTPGNVFAINHDAMGRSVSVFEPGRSGVYLRYNAFGELVVRTDDRGTTNYYYDDLGRALSRSDSDDNQATFQWDYANGKGLGKLWKAISSDGVTEEYSYDLVGRAKKTDVDLTGALGPLSLELEYDYDPAGRVSRVYYPNVTAAAENRFAVQYDYAINGDLQYVRDGTTLEALAEVVSRDAGGRVTRLHYANGFTEDRQFNSRAERIDGSSTQDALGRSVFSADYDWDAAGSLEKYSWTATGWAGSASDSVDLRPQYDRRRVLDVVRNGAMQQVLDVTVNACGNLTMKSDVESGVNYVYDPSKPYGVATIGPRTFGYDDSGNQNVRPGQNLTYTLLNALKTVQDTNEGLVSYYYNASGTRAGRVDPNEKKIYLGRLYELTEQVASGEQRETFTIAAAGAVVQVSRTVGEGGAIADVTHYLHRDHIGSPIVISKGRGGTGEVEGHRRYDVFGALASDAATYVPEVTVGYSGHEDELELGLVNMGGRVYDAEIGRFLQPDLLFEESRGGQYWNRYSYTLNSPLTFADPSGWDPPGEIPTIVITPPYNYEYPQDMGPPPRDDEAPAGDPAIDGRTPETTLSAASANETALGSGLSPCGKPICLSPGAAGLIMSLLPLTPTLRSQYMVRPQGYYGGLLGRGLSGAELMRANANLVGFRLNEALTRDRWFVEKFVQVLTAGSAAITMAAEARFLQSFFLAQMERQAARQLALEVASSAEAGAAESLAASGARTAAEAGIPEGIAARIQAVATRTNQTITVVGSRANGTATVLSDWDYIMSGNSAARHLAARLLPRGPADTGSGRGFDILSGPLDPTLPHVIFEP